MKGFAQKQSLQIKQKPSLWQGQRLAVAMLTMNRQECDAYLDEMMMSNPFITFGPEQKIYHPSLNVEALSDSIVEDNDDPITDLVNQIRLLTISDKLKQICIHLIYSLDEHGFLIEKDDELAYICHCTAADIGMAKKILLRLSPFGVGMATIRDYFLAQINRMDDAPELAEPILQHYYEDLLHAKWTKIAKALSVPVEEVSKTIGWLKNLSLYPFRQFDKQKLYIQADIIVAYEDHRLTVKPAFEYSALAFDQKLFDEYLAKSKKDLKEREVKTYLQQCRSQFKELQQALRFRQSAVLSIGMTIVDKQNKFFSDANQVLDPLYQYEVASICELSTSTVSRICKSRYLLFKNRLYPFSAFFSHRYGEETSGQYISQLVSKLITEEDKQNPLSDQEITEILQRDNITLSRRMVSKIRNQMGIPNSYLRKNIAQ